jgi:hypothetical protein
LYPLIAKQLTEDAAAERYNFLDLTPAFASADVQAFTDYCHLTPAGNQVVANTIFEYYSAKMMNATSLTFASTSK